MGGVKLAAVNRIGGSSRNFARPYLFDLTVADSYGTVGGIASICVVQSVYGFRSGLVRGGNGSRTRTQGNGIGHGGIGIRTNSNTLGSCLRAAAECDGILGLCMRTTTDSQRVHTCGVSIVTQSHSLLCSSLGDRTDGQSLVCISNHAATDSNGICLAVGSIQSQSATNADAVVTRSTVTQADNAAIYIQTAAERKVFATRATRIAMEQSTVDLAGSICRATLITEGICTRHTAAAGLPGRPFQVVISQKEQRVSSC